MALEGTLSDFGLADIFQLIGLQKKTGVLTLRNDKEEARILFMNGLVVGADTNNQKLENRLGRVLVKSNRISQAELEQALAIQAKTLQRLGQVLISKSFIKPEDLRDSLQTQVTQIIYRLFRWTDGEYHFRPERYVDYDQENFTPISSESILMEGVRMLDEWPMIERVIPDFDILVERTPRGKKVKLQIENNFTLDSGLGESFDSLLEGVMSDGGDTEHGREEIEQLDHQQELVLKLVDGPTVVQDVIDRSGLNEFETCRALYDLMGIGYVQRVTSDDVDGDYRVIEEERQIPLWIPVSFLVILATFSFFVSWNPLNQYFSVPGLNTFQVNHYESISLNRLRKVAQGIDLYFIQRGELPASLGLLVRQNFVRASEIVDPLGREFDYDVFLNENRYKIYGKNIDGSSLSSLQIQKILTKDRSTEQSGTVN
ncbi:DUF4388 domain-containing protein [Sulfidibacter corallicola]|uniref:DUF4388 domain-containing protein n=1 Tax=Sulfidibacter corallicola TaxID=2818388 RepID=A0A8A4TNG2_SULCO|nr:DUF4388 domain-containing protein [Sulfidibacter corallicola]QTD48125.1 DUF4388 domain-containing protein [Sulfidibacter corallicola]